MADLTITPADVKPQAGAILEQGTAGETITAGQPLYLNATDNKWYLSQSDGTQTEANATAVSMSAAAANENVILFKRGSWAAGATVVKGTVYVVSANAGKIAPISDLVSTNYVSILAVATSTTVLKWIGEITDVQV